MRVFTDSFTTSGYLCIPLMLTDATGSSVVAHTSLVPSVAANVNASSSLTLSSTQLAVPRLCCLPCLPLPPLAPPSFPRLLFDDLCLLQHTPKCPYYPHFAHFLPLAGQVLSLLMCPSFHSYNPSLSCFDCFVSLHLHLIRPSCVVHCLSCHLLADLLFSRHELSRVFVRA